jgi:phytanoyl-CoA hydroxylase
MLPVGSITTNPRTITRGIPEHGFSFHLDILHSSDTGTCSEARDASVEIPDDLIQSFQRDGFVAIPHVLDQETVNELNHHLEQVLQGIYNRNQKPDKTPSQSTRGQVLQVVNAHKCDSVFRQLAVSPVLGHVVAQLAQWTVGTRLAQDQIWAKPPGAPGLVFHRDSPYFMFDDPSVMTVWIALDTMDAELGPLEYIPGSHTWSSGNNGGMASPFFSNHDAGRRKLVQAAAAKQHGWMVDGDPQQPLRAGGISIHDGRTWHGSGNNHSTSRPRRGLGLHFVPANVKFTTRAQKSQLWKQYVQGMDADQLKTAELDTEDFPITWQPNASDQIELPCQL